MSRPHYSSDPERGCAILAIVVIVGAILEPAIAWIWGILAAIGVVLLCIALLGLLIRDQS